MRENLVKKLMAATKCAACGRSYRADDVSILGHEDDLWFVTVSCSACEARYLVAAVIREGSGPGVVTDPAEVERKIFRSVPAITTGDVLDMRGFLENFDGDFYRLFKQQGLE